MNIEFGMRFGKDGRRGSGEHPTNLLIVGDFSSASDVSSVRHMLNVEWPDIDTVMSKVAPRLRVGEGAEGVEVEFTGLDDFHPDRLLRKVPAFSEMRELRRALTDPARRESAVAVSRALLGPEYVATKPPAPAASELTDTGNDALLASLLGRPASREGETRPAVRTAVDRLLAAATADQPLVQSDDDATRLAIGVDTLTADALRALLHDSRFQALESTWRTLDWFGERLDTDDETSTWIADVSPAAPENWVDELCDLAGQRIGDIDAVVVLHAYGTGDIAQLAVLAGAAARLGATLFAGSAGSLCGLAGERARLAALDRTDFGGDEPEDWLAFRRSGAAARLVLGFPRFLLRQPYGQRSDPVDGLEFEELPARPEHDDFLWGASAAALAILHLTDSRRLDDLPMVVYEDGSGQAMKPVAENWLSESAANAIADRGIVPLIGHRGGTHLTVTGLFPVSG